MTSRGWSLVALSAVVVIFAGCSGPSEHDSAADGSPPGELRLQDQFDQAFAGGDPEGELAAVLAESGFEDASGCIANRMVESFDRAEAVEAAAGLEGEFLFDDRGTPVHAGTWRLLRLINECGEDEISARLQGAGLPEEVAVCIAAAAVDQEPVAIALTLFSASLLGPHDDEADVLSSRLLAQESSAPDSGNSAAALLVARASECVPEGAAGEFLAAGRVR